MIICVSVVKGDANIIFIPTKTSLVKIIERDHVKVLFIKLQVFFKCFQLQKDGVEPGMVLQTDAVVDHDPAAPCIPVKFFVKPQ
jgi:hypothetical protein